MNWSLESADTATAPGRGASEMDDFIRRNVMYWIANAHPLGVVATVGINGALMAFALWLSARAEELLWRFPSFRSQRWLTFYPCLPAGFLLSNYMNIGV